MDILRNALQLQFLKIAYLTMFYSIVQQQHKFSKLQSTKLLLIIPLCSRTIVLFYDDFSFYHYSMIDKKVLYEGKLPGKAFKGVANSAASLLITIADTRTLVLLNLKTKEMKELMKIPNVSYYNAVRQKQIFFQVNINSFKQTGNFYLQENKADERKIKYIYFQKTSSGEYSILTNEIQARSCIDENVDEEGTVIVYQQAIQEPGRFKFRLINFEKEFEEIEYMLQSDAFTNFATIRMVKYIGNGKYIIFINSNHSQFFVFHLKELNAIYTQETNKIFLSSLLINIELGYGIFTYFSVGDAPQKHTLEFTSLQKGTPFQSMQLTLLDYTTPAWESDYFITYNRQKLITGTTNFRSLHVISKEVCYMKILTEMGVQKQFQGDFCGEIMSMLRE